MIGRWSYGIYLWQIPVLLVILHFWGAAGRLPFDGRAPGILVCIGLAAVSYVALESPIRRWPVLARNPRLTLTLAAVTILVGLVVVTLNGS
jgi:peptidoglycan/LPS O-acetylase OafA/YrhL